MVAPRRQETYNLRITHTSCFPCCREANRGEAADVTVSTVAYNVPVGARAYLDQITPASKHWNKRVWLSNYDINIWKVLHLDPAVTILSSIIHPKKQPSQDMNMYNDGLQPAVFCGYQWFNWQENMFCCRLINRSTGLGNRPLFWMF